MGNLKIEKLDKMVKKAVIQVRDTMIRTLQENGIDYICITDIARQKNPVEPKDVVKNWMRVKNTLEYLGLWEKLNNLNFKGVEFDPLLNEAGNRLVGWKQRELLVLSRKMEREEVHTPRGISRLSLPVGFPWNLNYT